MKEAKWVLLGGETLLGIEIRDLISQRKLPVSLQVASTKSDEKVISRDEDELLVISPLDASMVDGADVILLGGTSKANKMAFQLAKELKTRPAFVDMFCDFEDKPAARLRAPLLEDKKVAADADTIHCIAHPAAVTLARLLVLLHAMSPVERCVATIHEPVSEYGKEAIDELHKQAVSLFNFQPMPKEVFDTQVSFTLSPSYGEDSTNSLAASELRIEKHLATLLGPRKMALPSIRLIHAPVFHGHCQNVWVEFAKRPAVAEIEKALADAGADVRPEGTEPASNVGVAGHSGMILSNINEDRSHGRGMWLWVASDNLRTRADNALLTAALLTRKKVK